QVIPGDHRMVTQAVITGVDDRRRRVKADGLLSVDGLAIFQMNDVTLGLGAGDP
ncbi:MAG: hypothetical protein JOZ53_04200, partial [Planctomycetaceae bacterium]|nr:hypothetical protein [Planctomycetaceae bacterium]